MNNAYHEKLYKYYLREITYLRERGKEFANRYPLLASRLDLGDNASTDPHVERLLESFAFLTGRIQYDLNNEFMEIPAALLGLLYPHFLAPIPSMTIAQFTVDPEQGKLSDGYVIDRGTALFAEAYEGQICHFRTCYPVSLWPSEIRSAAYEPTDDGIVLRLKIQAMGLTLSELRVDRLRFFINGDSALVSTLYNLLECHLDQASIRASGRTEAAPEGPPGQWSWPAQFKFAGFDIHHAVLPDKLHTHHGYRLLTEFFVFPQKFHFFDISAPDGSTFFEVPEAEKESLQKLNHFEIRLTLDQKADLERDKMTHAGMTISENTFALGCTPIINLFKKTSEPIRLDHRKTEYKLVADARHESTTEVYGIEKVYTLSGQGAQVRTLPPFYALDHTAESQQTSVFWHGRRQPSFRRDLPGTEMLLSFVDLAFDPKSPQNVQTVYAETLCTNRRLAEQLTPGSELQLEGAAPVSRIACLGKPTPQLRPPMRGWTLWRLVSHLSLNHLSLFNAVRFVIDTKYSSYLDQGHVPKEVRFSFQDKGIRLSQNLYISKESDGKAWLLKDHNTGRDFTIAKEFNRLVVSDGNDSLRALQEILKLYSISGRSSTRDQILGIERLSCRRIVGRAGKEAWAGFARGTEVTLYFNEEKYQGQAAILLASVLNHFLPLYALMNSFTKLVVKSKQREGVWKEWSPMHGAQSLL
ncbi:type VI secretion system baseplate subunit TssF [bacterium]|nr:type VI secretion system baseplate subunit TssF [bacterium]